MRAWRKRSRTVAEALLKVQGLSKRFAGFSALDEVSFEVYPGQILGLIGPNGAGKTTLLECVAGLMHHESGALSWRGGDFPSGRRKEELFYLPDGILPHRELCSSETLRLYAQLYGADLGRVEDLIRRLDLRSALEKRVGALSKGTLKRLLLAIGLLTPQPLLLLDEPFDGLDLRQTRSVMALLKEVRTLGRILLLSIHQLADAERVCDRFLLLKDGRLLGSGTLEELKTRAPGPAGSLEEVFLALT
ncbi:MAG: ABC transporter ATP-binding protein [Elusimicrobia bacterium]|nr:ABC transporter ATP-binding protein [Elusimicrobiota bacterium]